MCIYANAFVAGKNQDSVILPQTPEGLQVTFDGEIHSIISEKFKDVEGVYLVLHDGHCLCSHDDWKALFQYIEDIRETNNVDKVPLMVFFSSSEYPESSSIEVDPELDDTAQKPNLGDIMFVGVSVERRLVVNVGNQISLLFKDGKTLTGTLTNYQAHEQYGEIETGDETVYFNSSEIRHIDTII